MVDWDSLTATILDRLDLRAEAELLGVRFAAGHPNASGWLACHAIDREDRSPSAAICVAGSNGVRGRYKDSGGEGAGLSFFDLAAKLGQFSDFREARAHFAAKLGIEAPAASADAFEDKVSWTGWAPATALIWTEDHKRGITPKTLLASGARMGFWPVRSSAPHHVIGLPAYNADAEPCGWTLYRTDGQQFPAVDGKLKSRKAHCVKGSKNGWVIASGGWSALQAAAVVWIVEGPPDALALAGLLPPGEVAITGIFGANEDPARLPMAVLKGKRVRVLPQRDKPGLAAGKRKAAAAAKAGAAVELVELPYPLTDNHGKDVRDWVIEGNGAAALAALPTEAVDARDAAAGESPLDVANWRRDGEGEDAIRVAIPLPQIADAIHDSRDGWPISVSGLMYRPNHAAGPAPDFGALRPISDTADLFAWLRQTGGVRWTQKECANGTPASQAELLSQLSAAPRRSYSSVAYLPHEPRIADTYYVDCSLPPSDGEALQELMARLNPETKADWWLMLAALLTPGWGGPPGARPMFLFTSDHGRGAGKTKTAETIADVWGGAVSGTLNRQKFDEFKSRLLDNSALPLRVALLDNIKGVASSAEIEGLVTTRTIDGKRMYHGDFRRPNWLTWFVTANSPSMSKDLADRSVVIRIGPPKGNDFGTWADSFIRANRLRLVADLMAMLAAPDKCELDRNKLDRWAAWQTAILAKFPNGNELADHIRNARTDVDIDSEEAADVAEVIRTFVRAVRRDGRPLDPDKDTIALPAKVLYELLKKHWSEPHMTDKAASFRLADLASTSALRLLKRCSGRRYGRCWIWGPPPSPCYPWSNEWLLANPSSEWTIPGTGGSF